MKLKKIIFILLITTFLSNTLYISYKITLNDLPERFIKILEYKYKKEKIKFKIDFLSIIVKSYKSKTFINNEKKIVEVNNKDDEVVLYKQNEPIVYIYNTHTNEEYSYNSNNIYNVTPTILTASYILKSELEKFGINSIVEENNTTNIVNERGLPYSSSYKVSRELLENKKLEYPSLIYFIDLHRDSVERKITTTTIDNVSYARLMFLLGLENENYMENKSIMEKLNNYLNENYKGLSRGIYEKQGRGVNGVYNQDFNKNTMLIEVGGVGNTIDEVSNSIKVIAKMLDNYIKSNNPTNN